MTLSQTYRLLAWLALFPSALHAQDLSFAQPPLERHTVAMAFWPTAEGGNGHFYEVVASPAGITWTDAESYAEARGGYLATINSARENVFVFKLIDAAQFWLASPGGDSWGPWLGGLHSPPPNANGEAWQWLNHEGPFNYVNWSPKYDASDARPNLRLIFFGPGANNRQPTWSQVTADEHLHGFVVEYDTDPLPGSLQYVALFGVTVVGLIALVSVVYFVVLWKRQRAANSLRLDG